MVLKFEFRLKHQGVHWSENREFILFLNLAGKIIGSYYRP